MGHAVVRAIVDLLPRYAHHRRAGWTPDSLTDGRVTLPEYLLLRRVAIERDDAQIPLDGLCVNALNPYNTIDSFLDRLPRLVELRLLDRSGDDYSLTSLAIDLLTRGERAANDYATSRMRLPPDELAQLASMLRGVADQLHQAPEPADKLHQDRVPRLRRFDPRQTPPVQLEYALYALQRARDDAHIAAWRGAGFRGPEIELLSSVWAGDGTTLDDLVKLTHGRMGSDDVAALLEELERNGHVTIASPRIAITDRGREARDAIEDETDRVYFAPWPEIDAGWVRGRLEVLTAGLVS